MGPVWLSRCVRSGSKARRTIDTQSPGTMEPIMDVRSLKCISLAGVALSATLGAGCVSPAVLKDTLEKLEESHVRTNEIAMSLEAFKQEAAAQIQALKLEQARLGRELASAHTVVGDAQTDLESSEYHLTTERQTRVQAEDRLTSLEVDRKLFEARIGDVEKRLDKALDELGDVRETRGRALARIEYLEEEHAALTTLLAAAQSTAVQTQMELAGTQGLLTVAQNGRYEAETHLAELEEKQRQLDRLGLELRRERNLLNSQVGELRTGIEAAQVALMTSKSSLTSAQSRITSLEEEKTQAIIALMKAQKQARMLESALAAEQENWLSLQKALSPGNRRAQPPTE